MSERFVERPVALLVLADGTVFEGEAMGSLRFSRGDGTPARVATGELVFNTCLSGYQEVVTDPSYAGQVIAFTYPHIGNYGVSPEDEEARRPFCRGIVVRDITDRPSSWRSSEGLASVLVRHDVAGITGIDTRRLTRHVREAGAMPCALGTAPLEELLAAARAEPGTEGVDLVAEVTTTEPYRPRRPGAGASGTAGSAAAAGRLFVVAYDYGIKATILRNLAGLADVEVVPATTPAADVLARRPDGIFLSNGPGDPAALQHLVTEIGELIGTVPIFGLCLG
ncbi:MAG: carbamoyl phosphate synthase small subunit, partial [Acidimicrobiales bacterium]